MTSRKPAATSPRSSSPLMKSPFRPTFWRSTPPWRPPGRARPAWALPWWPMRSAAWRSAAPRPRGNGGENRGLHRQERPRACRSASRWRKRFEEIMDKVRKVDNLVANIATASKEQSQGIEPGQLRRQRNRQGDPIQRRRGRAKRRRRAGTQRPGRPPERGPGGNASTHGRSRRFHRQSGGGARRRPPSADPRRPAHSAPPADPANRIRRGGSKRFRLGEQPPLISTHPLKSNRRATFTPLRWTNGCQDHWVVSLPWFLRRSGLKPAPRSVVSRLPPSASCLLPPASCLLSSNRSAAAGSAPG